LINERRKVMPAVVLKGTSLSGESIGVAIGMIIFIAVALITLINIFVDWDWLLNRSVRCVKCGKSIKYREAHEVLHGMGPESECWSEYYCKECRVPDHTAHLTAHNIR
jgi:hypothetical protein